LSNVEDDRNANGEEADDGMPRHVLEELFNIHDPVYDFHVALLAEVEERVGAWEPSTPQHNSRNNNNHHAGLHPHHENHHRRLSASGPSSPNATRIGAVFHNNMPKMTTLYLKYLAGHRDVMEGLEYALKDSTRFNQLIRDFEAQKVCYLPLFSFILKPLHRLTHYQALLRREFILQSFLHHYNQ
jgi:hypothetical protein